MHKQNIKIKVFDAYKGKFLQTRNFRYSIPSTSDGGDKRCSKVTLTALDLGSKPNPKLITITNLGPGHKIHILNTSKAQTTNTDPQNKSRKRPMESDLNNSKEAQKSYQSLFQSPPTRFHVFGYI